MKIFIDSSKINEIDKWLKAGICDGVTTNPSIMCKEGVCDIEKGAKEIAKLIAPRPLSVEVTTNVPKEMLNQAKKFSQWADNIVIKIPIINQDGENCLGVINELSKNKIRVNATVILSLGQLVLAAKSGASYVSIFSGRLGDEGGDAPLLIKRARQWIDLWNYPSEIIVGSIRTIIDIQEAIIAGAHVITIPPLLIDKMCDHKYTRETVRQFIEDSKKTGDRG